MYSSITGHIFYILHAIPYPNTFVFSFLWMMILSISYSYNSCCYVTVTSPCLLGLARPFCEILWTFYILPPVLMGLPWWLNSKSLVAIREPQKKIESILGQGDHTLRGRHVALQSCYRIMDRMNCSTVFSPKLDTTSDLVSKSVNLVNMRSRT